MKSKTKKTGLLLLICALLSGSALAQNGKLYVYKNDGSNLEYAVSDVQKLSFTSSALVVNKTGGASETVAFTDLKLFSLTEYLFTGLDKIAQPEVNAYFDAAGTLVIKGINNIASVTLFNIQGQKLQQTVPNVPTVTLPATNYPAGIYILQIADANEIAVKKIIKK